MKFDLSKVEFKINWASGVTLVVALSIAIGFYLENKSLKGSIGSLKETVTTLNETVTTQNETISALKGSQEVTNNAIKTIMEFPAGEIKYRLDKVENDVNRHHGTHSDQPTEEFHNSIPE